MKSLTRIGLLATAVLATFTTGCGSGESAPRQDILDRPAEELHGASIKAMLYEFRAIVRKHGVSGAKRELPILLENFEGYEDQPVGEHGETYTQIADKLNALQAALAGSPTREQVAQAAEEIGGLADKLPGKAAPDPEVD